VATGSCTDLVPVPRDGQRIEARVGPVEGPWLVAESSCGWAAGTSG
jgi:hypothetical protein